MNYRMIAAGVSLLAITAAAQAQENDAVVLDTIVISPNRAPTDKNATGSKVETVEKQEIEQKSRPLVLDYLNLLPGIAINSSGGPGSDSSLAIRGLPRRYVKTLFNGIDIADPTGTQKQAQYQYLLTGGMENIEVLKGSQGTLYGSEAIAGVISMNTLGGVTQGIHHELDLEGGSFGTVRGRYGLKAANERSKLAINVSGLTTDGINVSPNGSEKDGFDNVQLDANFEARVNETVSVFGSALYIDGKSDYDNFDSTTGATDTPDNRNHTKQRALRGGVNIDLLEGRLKNTFSAQIFEIDRNLSSVTQFGPLVLDYMGQRQKLEYQGSFEATEWALLQYGADYDRQNAKSDDGYAQTDDSASMTGLWGQLNLTPVENLALAASIRQDEHSNFGGFNTYRATGSYLFEQTGTRLHASNGTGFRAPSLYELNAFGNINLKPETSLSFDIGVEQRLLNDRMLVDVTYFDMKIKDRIDYRDLPTPPYGLYEQIPGTTRSQGVELAAAYAATDWLDLAGSYTYTHSRTDQGLRSARIPEHAVVLSAVAQPFENWTVAADVKFVFDTVDTGATATDRVELDDYVLLNAKLAYKPNENTEIYVRGENLLNQDYRTARGYEMPGIGGFAGVKLHY